MNTATLELPSITTAAASAPALKDLLQEGIYLLFLLRNGNVPASAATRDISAASSIPGARAGAITDER